MSRKLGFTNSIFVGFLCFGIATLLGTFLATQPRVVLAADGGSSEDHSDKTAADAKSDHEAPATDKAAPNADAAEDAPTATSLSAKTPEEAAARRKAENEDYEFYKSLADTIDQVERNYVKPIDRRELMEAAIKGVLSKLDPYSNYISPDEINGFRTSVESQFGGIGIQITPDDGQIKVSSPLVGTPAYKAGVMAGDRILSIEGQSTRGLSLDDVVRRLKGDIGTSVTFTVRHALTGKEESFTIKREMIHVDTVMGESRLPDDSWNFMLDPDQHIGYIRVSAFSRDTAADLKQALEKLKQQKVRGLILDLRFNPGGLLTSAVDVCNMFISEGRIVSTKGRNTPERVWDATPSTKFEGFPMVVLVNEYSASASEIVSACLQDHQRATIVGERTWGKGSVQNVIELEDGKSALKLTTATYTRPNGHNIHRFPDAKETDEWGVKPNDGMEVRLSDGEMAALVTDRHQHDMVTGKAHEEKQKAAAGTSEEHADNSSAEKISKSTAATDNTSVKIVAKDKPTASIHPSKYTDRQLQKAVEYLSTKLARAQ
jgi:carboxyl-terminal processing protease